MKIYRKTNYARTKLNTTEYFEGESLEEKVRRTMETNAPVEAIAPMVYTERKDGVRKDCDIRTDKWDVAQEAMTSIADGIRQKRSERMDAKTVKPNASSEVNAPVEN